MLTCSMLAYWRLVNWVLLHCVPHGQYSCTIGEEHFRDGPHSTSMYWIATYN